MNARRLVMAALVATCISSRGSAAQLPTGQSVRPGQPTRTPGDTLRTRADSVRAKGDTLTGRDTLARPNFAPPDSVMQRLMNTPGTTVTQYQGKSIAFDAVTRGFDLTSGALTQAIVLRDSNLVKSDTISYSGSGSNVRTGAAGKGRNVFVSPGQSPIISTGKGSYDIAARRASVSGVQTSIPQSGQTLFITGDKVVAAAGRDSLKNANSATFYVRDGTVTACDDSIPDYYFKAKEIKRTGTFVVARPAVLYIGDVPVMWLPFLFQDIRGGRHSGILAPNVGVSDIVRNSASYRRNVEGLGYYVAISDFLDAQAFVDWRSSAGQSNLNDPGFTRYNGELRYRWLDRYVTGGIALSHTRQSETTNDALSWNHQQNFTRNSALTTSVNLVKNTQLQRQTTVNPYAALATISSQANYQQKIGPAQLSLGGSQKQYPGRTQLDRSFPSLSVSTSPINLGSFLSWTPSLSYSSSQSYGIDQPSQLGLFLSRATIGGRDTIKGDTIRRAAYTSQLSFDTPLTILGYSLGNRFSVNSARNDFAEREIVTDVLTGVETERIYSTTYKSEADWTPSFTLPPLARNNFNLTPSLSFENVDGGPLFIRNERTGGAWVHQTKRPTFGLSASPTIFGLFTGFGPFERIRHSITPSFGYRYAPARSVSDEYLRALGRTKYNKTKQDTSGYLGALAQNALTFQLSTNIEGKARSTNDSNPDAGEKLKLLSLNFSGFSYDIERARYTHSTIRGLTTQNFNYTVRSDLLPGVDVGVDYSLFDSPTVSDSAKFSPFRQHVTASVSFSNTNNPFTVFAKLFGGAKTEPLGTSRNKPILDNRFAPEIASQSVAGRSSRTSAILPTTTEGWQAHFNFSSSRQRPPSGDLRNVVAFDPTIRCQQFNTAVLRLAYDQCVANARTNPAPETPITSGTIGSPIYLTPDVTSLSSDVSFALTDRWSATWNTQYDFEQRNFASQIVSLQRDLHDWRAIFAFTQSPNGSFAFNFLISLKAEPELKFDYHKSTYRNEGLTQIPNP